MSVFCPKNVEDFCVCVSTHVKDFCACVSTHVQEFCVCVYIHVQEFSVCVLFCQNSQDWGLFPPPLF